MAGGSRYLMQAEIRRPVPPVSENGRKGVAPAPRIFDTSDQKLMTPTVFVGPKHNFYSLTVCRLDQYLPNGSENTALLP